MDATVQLNARMSKSLKESGDEALALIGFTPTQAVRALWEKASRRGKDLEEVEALLRGVGKDHARDVPDSDDALVESWTIVERTLASFDIDYGSYERPQNMPGDKELLEQALCERMAEKGLA